MKTADLIHTDDVKSAAVAAPPAQTVFTVAISSPIVREYNDILRISSPEKSFKINERYKNLVVDNPDDAREIDNEDKSSSFRPDSVESSDL